MGHSSDKIRNIALLGHSGSGKTTFAENMLFEAKAISRRGNIGEGTTSSDHTNIEKERGTSIFSTLMTVNWKDTKLNILDTPGLDDFVGEVISSLRIADTSVMLLNAKSGVEVGTELLWEYIEQYKTPNLFVVNHLDNDKADFEATLEQTKNRFGNKVIPMQFPVNAGDGFNAIVDCLKMVMYEFPEGGGKPDKKEIPAEHMDRAKEWHNAIVEAAAEHEESLMETYFDKGTLSEEEMAAGLKIGFSNQEFFPVFCCSAERNMGSGRIMGFIHDIGPSPVDRVGVNAIDGSEIPVDSSSDPSVFIFKTLSEPNVGNLSYFKVCSGTLTSGADLVNSNSSTTERLNQIFSAVGKTRTQVDALQAGDIGVTVKLKGTKTNETLAPKGSSLIVEPIQFPNSRIRTAVNPPSKNDMEKLAKALAAVQEEDPTFRVEYAKELKQTILHGQGELHLDLIKYRINKVYGVDMEFERPKISYRETITKAADGNYRHKKQSGGSGQFGEVSIRIEPYYEGMPEPSDLNVRKTEEEDLSWGGKLIFKWCIVGGAIDSKFSNAIKKGILMKMEEGPQTGSPVQDIRVCVYDGKMHAVDSNDMAFQLAASNAFKNTFLEARPQILEPMYNLDILCPEAFTGDVMSDLQTRRAIIQGMDSVGHYQKISAKVPLAEMHKYSSSLRSLTQGKAKFNIEFSDYQQVTPDIQNQLVKENKADLQEA